RAMLKLIGVSPSPHRVVLAVSPLGGPGCCGSAFMAFNLPPNCFRTVIEKRSVMQGLGEELATSQISHPVPRLTSRLRCAAERLAQPLEQCESHCGSVWHDTPAI